MSCAEARTSPDRRHRPVPHPLGGQRRLGHPPDRSHDRPRRAQTRCRAESTRSAGWGRGLGSAPKGSKTGWRVSWKSEALARQAAALRDQLALAAYEGLRPQEVAGVMVLAGLIPDSDADALRRLADRFRADRPSGVAVLASAPGGKPVLIAAVSQDLVARGLHAGNLVKDVAKLVGGGGGGKAEMAQAGGKDASRLPEALARVPEWVRTHLR